MQIKSVENLSNIQLDTLKEIGNIGQGQATNALAQMTGQFVNVSVPSVRLLDFNETVNYLGNSEELAVGILVTMNGDIGGMMLQVFKESAVSTLISALMGQGGADIRNLTEMDISCLEEIANILASSYVNAISSLTGMSISVSTPNIMVDMVGAILSIPAVEFAKVGNKTLLIDNNFIIDSTRLMCDILLIPDVKSLPEFFSRLGVDF